MILMSVQFNVPNGSDPLCVPQLLLPLIDTAFKDFLAAQS